MARHPRHFPWIARRSLARELIISLSALLSGCMGLALPLASMTGSAAMSAGGLIAKNANASARQAAIETGLIDKTFAYPQVIVESEVFPHVAESHDWRVVEGDSSSCSKSFVIAHPPSASKHSAARVVKVTCFYIESPLPTRVNPTPSTSVVVSNAGAGNVDDARAFGKEILDELGRHFAGLKPQTAEKVYQRDLSVVLSGIERFASGWNPTILSREVASNSFRISYWSSHGGTWVDMDMRCAADGSNTSVTLVGDGTRSEMEFRVDAMMFFHGLSQSLADKTRSP